MENEPREYRFICNETGNELPEMHAHWAKLEVLLGARIERVRHTEDLAALCSRMNALPSWRMRWCTRILKIEPTVAYMQALPEGSTLYVGLRADEEARRGIYGDDVALRFPLREQGMDEAAVWRFLDSRGVSIPRRTDCAWCPYQMLEEWHALWLRHPELYAEGIALEDKTGHTFRSPGRDTWPADLRGLAEAFASGRKLRKSSRGNTCRVCSL